MARSSGLPTGRLQAGITRIIRARAGSTVVSRPTTTTGALDQEQETTDDHTLSLWLYAPSERNTNRVAGERIEGDLGGLAVADGTVDLEHNDRITHGGVEYEVDTIVGQPEDDVPDGTESPDTNFWVVNFVRRQ